jgi:aminoglycoside 3-N-acetyltransferase
MSVNDLARKLLPGSAVEGLIRFRKRRERGRVARLPLLTEAAFADILAGELGLTEGDAVFVHSAVDQLNLDFPFYRVLALLRRVVGARGTLLFPTYPNRRPVSSYEYLLGGNVFDVRRTPSYTGLLTEFARRQRDAIRSLHPTKSVCAAGPLAAELTREHHLSPYPYDANSPYRKLVDCRAKIVGLGVWTQYLSFVYTVDDALKDDPPVRTYHPRLFAARCIDREGREVTVATYAHDMRKVVHDVPRYVKKHVPEAACADLTLRGMKFFRADAARLFDVMLADARRGVTVYPRRVYEKRWRARADA